MYGERHNSLVVIKVKLLNKDLAALPAYQSAGAAGMDLCAALDHEVTLGPLQRAAIATGLALEIPSGYEGQVRPRSGRALTEGLTLLNTPGTIDSDYRGEIKVIVINLGNAPVVIRSGDRIAQLIIAPVTRAEIIEAPNLGETVRGPGAFGHTGR